MIKSNVAVIIPHKDDAKRLAICLELFAQQSVRPDEIIVVDNGSKNGSEVDRVCTKYGAILKICPENGSYHARNVGIQTTTADLLLFTDADCRPSPLFVQAYGIWCSRNCGLIAAGPVEVVPHSLRPNGWECLDIDTGYPQERYVQAGMAITANLAVKRWAIQQFGMFDQTLYSGGDIEFSSRIARNSSGIDWVAEAVIYHPARHSRAEHVERMKRVHQGVATMRTTSGLSPVAVRTWLLALTPPLARIPRLFRIPGVTIVGLVQAFVYACYLRIALLLFLISIREPAAVRHAGGKFK